jgi:hypothetical protein
MPASSTRSFEPLGAKSTAVDRTSSGRGRWSTGLARLAGAACIASSLTLLAVSCESSTKDPAKQKPATPISTTDGGELPAMTAQTPPAAPTSPLATHSAERFVLTRLSQVERATGGRPTIDLRFDALDANGRSTRMAGELRVILRAKGAEPETLAFDVRLATEDEQTRHFDETLSIYVVRLEPRFEKSPPPGTSIEVGATLNANGGGRFETSGSVAW